MKSREEIEEILGKKLQYVQHEVRSNSDWGNFGIDVLDTYWELTKDDIKKIKDLLESSIENNDIETALGCCNILGDNKVDTATLQQLIDETVQQLSEDVNSLSPETSTDEFKRITNKIHNVTRSNFSQNKSIIRLSELLDTKINSIMNSLDGRITELKLHIEIPENEEQIKALQEKLEGFESIQYGKLYERLEDTYRSRRIREEGGIELSDLVDEISEYKYNTQTQEIDQRVSFKIQYLEQKLAILKAHRDIPGNNLRIAEIQSQIEMIEDAWVVAQAGYNNIDGILQIAESRKNETQDRLVQVKQEIQTIDSMSMAYIQKRNEIESLTKEVAKYERYIERMQQTKAEIENGTNTSFMGKHHRDRLQREEQERVERNRGKIQELDEQIAELQQHIEIPENEQRIMALQAQIDEIESTIPADKGKHKRARETEQGVPKEDILENIDEVIKSDQSPYVTWKAERAEQQINTRVSFLTKKMEYLQQHLGIEGNDKRVADIQNEIEELEDKWELCIHGFGSKEQVDRRLRMSERYLNSNLLGGKTRDIGLTKEKVQEYWGRIQKGEDVPELLGKHHRERFEREQEAKEAQARAEQEAQERAKQEAREAQAKAEQEANAKAEQEAREAQARAEQEANAKAEQEAKEAQARAEQEVQERAKQEEREAQKRAKQEELKRQMQEHEEYMASADPQIKARVDSTMQEYWQSWERPQVATSKQYEQQQPEKIKAREKSIKDEVGEELRTTEKQVQKQSNPSVDLWMNRFNGWYSAIDRVSQSVKEKFVKMKSDIIKAISEKLKERTNNRQVNTQEQDTNER